MKIVITGSLGNISKPLTIDLLKKGHIVTVISHNTERKIEIEQLGAIASIGNIEDVNFLSQTFQGADIVYLMKPPFDIFDKEINIYEFYNRIGKNYVKAIENSDVRKVIHLSSVGAHTDKSIGMLRLHNEVENIFKELNKDVIQKIIRPVAFYTNMLSFIPVIKSNNAIVQNYGGDHKLPWVSPIDIAAVISEEIEKPFDDFKIRYVASDEISCNEIAKILGAAIGIPDLKWIIVSDEQFTNIMVQAGMREDLAKDWVDAIASIGNKEGELYSSYNLNKSKLGNVKVVDFAKDFAALYN